MFSFLIVQSLIIFFCRTRGFDLCELTIEPSNYYLLPTITSNGLFLIYRKLKSLIIHISRVEIINHSYTEEYSGHRGTVGTVRTEEQWAQRNSRHRGTVGTEEQWAQRNS